MTPVENIMEELIAYAYEKMEKNNAYPFCAFVVRENVIITRAYNRRVNLYGDKTTHGEMEALSKACKTLKIKDLNLGEKYELFTTCAPCLACLDTALWHRVSKIVYSVDHRDFPHYFHDHPYTIEDYEKESPGYPIIIKGILHDKGVALFQKAKKKYGW